MNPTVTPAAKLQLSADVRFRTVGGEGVIVRQSAAEVLVVNEVGAAILEQIDGANSALDIVERLAPTCDVERAQLTADVLAYLDELYASGVIVEHHPERAP